MSYEQTLERVRALSSGAARPTPPPERTAPRPTPRTLADMLAAIPRARPLTAREVGNVQRWNKWLASKERAGAAIRTRKKARLAKRRAKG